MISGVAYIDKWNGAQVERTVRTETGHRLLLSAKAVRSEIILRTSRHSPPPSLPGEFPHRRSGRLARGWRAGVDRQSMTAYVGNVEAYDEALELGTSKMQPRPHLYRTVKDMRYRILEIIGRPIFSHASI